MTRDQLIAEAEQTNQDYIKKFCTYKCPMRCRTLEAHEGCPLIQFETYKYLCSITDADGNREYGEDWISKNLRKETKVMAKEMHEMKKPILGKQP